ncbi:ornithine decarboxylase/arginine decarboxylase [Gregarina niphandrodes]|uniref:ornithine decarboxylase n=1 Tax=Gregarina niphandrodes TaxID=110365 RepID=A0A023B3U6_GRENI|nr:ornithine decarboxylase/arginine decarboxylase [Gregarina niphandrodes]EZG55952.1 ornithine decarboxylase/arginine decarboxylase [Gregarina niphandrodes]|eukprot:XP_011131395.1 ornithine decarboxylase/arginine decarboxylase [Gregarina niphandrodes]
MAGVCNPEEYVPAEVFEKVKAASASVATPALFMSVPLVESAYQELCSGFPYARVFYAVKANPARQILEALARLGSCFDVASVYELDEVLSLPGVDGTRVSYGNTIKKARDVRYAYGKGVRMFASDSEADLRNIAKAAPGSRIYVRIITDGSESADWPLSRKFGCHPDMAMDLLILSRELGLEPYGISFHVGSQQRDIATWDATIAKVKVIFERLREEDGIRLKMINMGGGLPANYVSRTNSLDTYTAEITRFLKEDFPENDDFPEIIIEPGRSLVANAGVIVSEVVLVSRKSRFAIDRWVYTDVGLFNGLIECLDEAIKFPLWTPREAEEEEVVLAGPTCDSMDILYENFRYRLPLNLCAGDKLFFLSTGAYTASYASVCFNGFPPIETHFV